MAAVALDSVFSGEVHSWRVDPDRWGSILDVVAGNGFNAVSAYVPWSVHEVAPGSYDFTGPRDVRRFLELAAERGLQAIVRPGPDAASEIPDSGWPRRVLEDPRCWALRSNGLPYILPTATSHVFPPSYLSKMFLDEVARWYDAVFEVLVPLQHPNGPILACQVDNEIGYHFQAHTFAMDYHPDSIAGFQAFVGRDVAPPRGDPDEPEELRVKWVEWREEYLRQALSTLASMQKERGMDRVPLIHNDYPRMATPLDPTALEVKGIVDVAAGDIYTGKEGGFWLKEFIRYVAGTSRLPFMLELGAGWLTLPWLFPMRVSPQDQEHVTLRAFLGGIRAANVYMLVERDRWYASPIAADGTPRPDRLNLYPRLIELLDRTGLREMKRWAPVLLLENRTESRKVAAREILGEHAPAVPHSFPVDRRLFEQPHPDTDLLRSWESDLTRVLNEAGVDFDRAVSSSLPDLSQYELIVMPSIGPIDPETLKQLQQVNTIVGPNPQPDLKVISEPEKLKEHLPTPPFASEADLYIWQGDGQEVVGAANSTGESLEATLSFEGSAKVEGLWKSESLSGSGSVSFRLEPWEIQVWEVSR